MTEVHKLIDVVRPPITSHEVDYQKLYKANGQMLDVMQAEMTKLSEELRDATKLLAVILKANSGKIVVDDYSIIDLDPNFTITTMYNFDRRQLHIELGQNHMVKKSRWQTS